MYDDILELGTFDGGLMRLAIEPVGKALLVALLFLAFSLGAISAGRAFSQTPEQERVRNRIAAIMTQTVGREVEAKGVKVWTKHPPSKDAVAEMKSFGDKAVPVLTEYLTDKDPRMRAQAIDFLGLLKSPKAIGPLQHVALKDPSPSSRVIALRWLGELPWDSVSHVFQQASKDPDANVREQALSLINVHKH